MAARRRGPRVVAAGGAGVAWARVGAIVTRRAARRDGNHAAIVAELRRLLGAACVFDLASVGDGMADIIVGDQGRNWLFEIKDPAQRRSARRLTPAEAAFHDAWPGQVDVIESVEDALRVMGRVG